MAQSRWRGAWPGGKPHWWEGWTQTDGGLWQKEPQWQSAGRAEPYWGARSAEPSWGARSVEPYWGTRDADDTNVGAEGNREAEAARSAVAEEAVGSSRLWPLDADEADAEAAAEWRREADIACSAVAEVEVGHFKAAQLWSSAPSPWTPMEKLMQAAKPPLPKPPRKKVAFVEGPPSAFDIPVPESPPPCPIRVRDPQLEEPPSAVADHDPSAVSETVEAVNVMPPNQGAPVKHKGPPFFLRQPPIDFEGAVPEPRLPVKAPPPTAPRLNAVSPPVKAGAVSVPSAPQSPPRSLSRGSPTQPSQGSPPG